MKTREQLCKVSSSSSEECLPLHKFCFQKIYSQRRIDRISAIRNAFLSTQCGDIFVWKQRGNHTILASYLKSLWFYSRSWTPVRSSRFSPPGTRWKDVSHQQSINFRYKSALIPPVNSELDLKISLRSFALSFWMSSNDEISISLY